MIVKKIKDLRASILACKADLEAVNDELHHDETCRAMFFLDEAINALERGEKDLFRILQEREAKQKAEAETKAKEEKVKKK